MLNISRGMGSGIVCIERQARCFCSRSPAEFSDIQAAMKYDSGMPVRDLLIRTDALRFSKILERYLYVAQKMRAEGLIPLVHGQSLDAIVSQTVLKKIGVRGLSCYRSWNPEMDKRADAIQEMLNKKIVDNRTLSTLGLFAKRWREFLFEKERSFFYMDHEVKVTPYLMSVTVGAFHHGIKESPFSLCFGGSVRNAGAIRVFLRDEGNQSVSSKAERFEWSFSMIRYHMQQRQYSEAVIKSLIARVCPIYEACDKVVIGQMIVVGIPVNVLDDYAYKSTVGGAPSRGHSLQATVQKGLAYQEEQARIIISSKSMSKDAPIQVVNVMDTEDVDEFCKGYVFNTEEVAEINEALIKLSEQKGFSCDDKDSENEQEALEQIENIKKQLKEVISDSLKNL